MILEYALTHVCVNTFQTVIMAVMIHQVFFLYFYQLHHRIHELTHTKNEYHSFVEIIWCVSETLWTTGHHIQLSEKWNFLYLLSEIAYVTLFLIAMKKYNNQKAACGAWKSLFLCMLHDHSLLFRETGAGTQAETRKQVTYLFSPYGLLIFPSYTT